MFDTAFRKGGAGGASEVAHRPPAPAGPGPHALRLAVSGGAPRVVQRACSCGGSGGPCPECEEKERVQTKLEVGPPGDEFEQEADAVADQVMRMPDPTLEEEEEQP